MELVCDRFWLRSISQSVFLMAKGAGLLFFGRLADRCVRCDDCCTITQFVLCRFGRRRIIVMTAPVQLIATFAQCFVREIYSFIALRFLQAATLYGMEVSCYVISESRGSQEVGSACWGGCACSAGDRGAEVAAGHLVAAHVHVGGVVHGAAAHRVLHSRCLPPHAGALPAQLRAPHLLLVSS